MKQVATKLLCDHFSVRWGNSVCTAIVACVIVWSWLLGTHHMEPHQTGVTLYPLHQIILTGVVFLRQMLQTVVSKLRRCDFHFCDSTYDGLLSWVDVSFLFLVEKKCSCFSEFLLGGYCRFQDRSAGLILVVVSIAFTFNSCSRSSPLTHALTLGMIYYVDCH